VLEYGRLTAAKQGEKVEPSRVLYGLDLLGVAVFAVSGVMTAVRKEMDIFGALVVATVTAIGGGTLRDLLLDQPVFWIEHQVYLWVVFIVTAVTLLILHRKGPALRGLLLADAFGLAVFTISGAQKAAGMGLSFIMVVIMAAMTGTAGGIMRDILCAEIPLVLQKEIYATAAIAGAAVYVLLQWLLASPVLSAGSGLAFVFGLRLLAIQRNINLPRLRFSRTPEQPGERK